MRVSGAILALCARVSGVQAHAGAGNELEELIQQQAADAICWRCVLDKEEARYRRSLLPDRRRNGVAYSAEGENPENPAAGW